MNKNKKKKKVLFLISLVDDWFFLPHFDFIPLNVVKHCRHWWVLSRIRAQVSKMNIRHKYPISLFVDVDMKSTNNCVLPLAIFAILLLVHLRSSSAAFHSYLIWIDFYLSFPSFFFLFENLVDTNNSVLKRNAKIECYFVLIFCLFFFRCYPYPLHIDCWWLCCDNLIACKTTQSIWISFRWNANNEINNNNNNIVFPSNLHIAKNTEQRKYFKLIDAFIMETSSINSSHFPIPIARETKNFAKYQRKTVIKKITTTKHPWKWKKSEMQSYGVKSSRWCTCIDEQR